VSAVEIQVCQRKVAGLQKYTRTIHLLVAVGLLLLLGACASGGGSSRGQVSDVAARAGENDQEEDDDEGRGSGRTRSKDDHRSGDSYSEIESDGDSFEESMAQVRYSDDYDDSSSDEFQGESPNAILWLSRANLGGNTISYMNTATLLYSDFRGSHLRTHVGLYYGRGRNGSSHLIQDGVDSIYEVGVDFGGRVYFTPRHTLVGLYFQFGLRYGSLNWSYAEGAELNGDGVSMFTPYVGAGSSFLQIDSLHLGGSVTYGSRISGSDTQAEYENDLFVDVGELRLNLEMSVFF